MLVLGCKSKEKAPAVDPVTPPAGSGSAAVVVAVPDAATAAAAAPEEFTFAPGESYFGGKVLATNLVEWKVADGSIVRLGIVTTGKTAAGREEGVLRAYHTGTASHDVDQKYSLDPAVDHWAELKLVSNNLVMFRYGEAGKTPRARNGVLLTWDADASRVRIVKRWSGPSKAAEPEWLLTGVYKAPAESELLCLKVISRMVSCAKDPKFRDALFRRDDPAAKAEMAEHFDTHVAKWKDPAEAKAQCQKWASDEYVDTHFSDPVRLNTLAGETKFDCGFFAAEIVDDGGLPVALVDAHHAR